MQMSNVLNARVELGAPHDPTKFYRSGPDILISKAFRERVVRKAEKSKQGTAIQAVGIPVNLAKLRSVSDLENEVRTGSSFDESQACAFIAACYDQQLFLPGKGERHIVLTRESAISIYGSTVNGFFLDAERRGAGLIEGTVRVFVLSPEN